MFAELTKKDLKRYGIGGDVAPNTPAPPAPQAPPLETSPLSQSSPQSPPPIEQQAEQILAEEAKASGEGAKEYSEDTALESSGFRAITYNTPYELLCFYDKDILSGEITIYPWQMEILDSVGEAKCDKQHPHKFCLCANNGSGKDAFFIAPCAVWLALCHVQGRVIITSASGNQLSSQTESYIRNLCRSVNEYWGQEIFRIRQRYIYCRLSGSEIRLFATDEEGKAEGYHPITPNAKMMIITNEGKSIEAKIYRALRRCTGFSYWLDVSSPGAPEGDFYRHFTHWKHKHVDYRGCPHGSEDERLEDLEELGENSSYYRSKWMALFTAPEGTSIIPQDAINRNVSMSLEGLIQPMHKDWSPRVGIDLAAGGAENSMYKIVGNAIHAQLHFREKDTTITAARIDAWLSSSEIAKDSEFIFSDDGGVSHAIVDQLCSNYGWNIARVNNQSPTNNKKMFLNRGAQNWFRAKRLFECNLLYFAAKDRELNQKLLDQLASRFYKQQQTQGRIALESKADSIAHGRPSPDRADAYILAFTGLNVDDFLGNGEKQKDKKDELTPREKLQRDGIKLRSNAEVESWHQEDRYKKYQTEMGQGETKGRPIRGSVRAWISQRTRGVRQNVFR
jgi:hypothetical protein